jgi:hypothetical protein
MRSPRIISDVPYDLCALCANKPKCEIPVRHITSAQYFRSYRNRRADTLDCDGYVLPVTRVLKERIEGWHVLPEEFNETVYFQQWQLNSRLISLALLKLPTQHDTKN